MRSAFGRVRRVPLPEVGPVRPLKHVASARLFGSDEGMETDRDRWDGERRLGVVCERRVGGGGGDRAALCELLKSRESLLLGGYLDP